MTDLEPPAPIERDVQTPKGSLHVRDHPTDGPAVVLMHGYPDDSGIYRRLIPELALFATVRRHEIADASHWPQWDQPSAVAATLARITADV